MSEIPTPTCIGFIMDGNRRWAKEHNLSVLEGHSKGYDVFGEMTRALCEFKIPHAVFYAFSTENWRRSEEEVGHLMTLLREVFKKAEENFSTEEKKVRVRFIGRREDFSTDIQEGLTELEMKTKDHRGTTVWLALSYGGRAEIVEAARRLMEEGVEASEEALAARLWTAGMPDPDIIIRTSGEQRLSNFLPWQSVYSELFFTSTYWPAFTKDEFTRILAEYATRERRRGA